MSQSKRDFINPRNGEVDFTYNKPTADHGFHCSEHEENNSGRSVMNEDLDEGNGPIPEFFKEAFRKATGKGADAMAAMIDKYFCE